MSHRQSGSVPRESSPANNDNDQKKSQRTEQKSASLQSSSRQEHEKNLQHSPSAAPPPPRGVKRFFLKLSEKIGNVEQTHYSQQFIETCQDIDNYRLAIEDLTTNLLAIAQRNTKYDPKQMERMEFEYPENGNPMELIVPPLNKFSDLLKLGEVTKCIEYAPKLGPLQRDFHRRARRALKGIRYFLCIEYEELSEAKKILNTRRQDMDYAKHEMKNAKSPEVIEMKHQMYEAAQKLFETQLQIVLGHMEKFPKQKEIHLKDVQAFFAMYRIMHEQAAHAIKG
uniref:BAR domain-containing protein n=1 Tax=Panagrellus redivivus TaxID=6233 RepID=A0A7E4UT04_PANRE